MHTTVGGDQQHEAMVIPDPTQPTDPVTPDKGTPISGHYQLLGGNQAVGTAENPLICWLNSSVGIEDTLPGSAAAGRTGPPGGPDPHPADPAHGDDGGPNDPGGGG